MKIGMFTDSYLPSHDGVAVSVFETAKQLQELGHQVFIVAPRYPHHKDPKNVYRVFSVRLYTQPEIRVGLEIPQRNLFKVASIDFDIIHGHSGGPISFLGLQIALLRDIPFVETYHTLWRHYRHYFPLRRLLNPRILQRASLLFSKEYDALIAPTAKVKHDLRRYGVKKPIYIVPTGIDIQKFHKPASKFLQRQLKLAPDKRIILTVGRLEKEKSHDFLIESFAKVHNNCPQAVMVIVGEGGDEQKLRNLAHTLHVSDHIFFAGTFNHQDMPAIYASAEIFIFASKTETQGLVIIEALAAGLPVIAVADTALTDVVIDNLNGYLVDKNPKLLAQKISHVLSNKSIQKKLSLQAKQSVAKYSIQESTKSLLDVYSELIGRHHAHTSAPLSKLHHFLTKKVLHHKFSKMQKG